jgi:signal transduction histidine kinase
MPSAQNPRAPLARSTLIKMGVRIAVVIALATLFSYLHMFSTLRAEALVQLEQYVTERSQREQAIFVLAEDNHSVLRKALEERIRYWRTQDPSARFDSLFAALPDGTVRNQPEGFDGTRMVGLFVPRGVALDDDLRRRILAAHDVLTQYGPAFHTRFTDTFITLPEGPNVVYWPEGPTYCQDAAPTESIISQEFFPPTLPEHNPERQTRWSGVYVEPVSKDWMVTVSTPVDVEGRHVATVSHDVLLRDLVDRTLNAHLPGAYNLLVRDDGQLIAHPELKLEGAATAYNVLSTGEQPGVWREQHGSAGRQAHLRDLFERLKQRQPGETVVPLPRYDEYLAVKRLQGPGWTFVTVLPERVVSQPALNAARYVLLLGLVSLLLELAIMFWVLKQQITRPLLAFTQAADQVAAGNFKVQLDTARGDELGQLATAFGLMAHQVQRREEELRKANEQLEQRVEERTEELRSVHQRLMQVARQAGMAEVATNVLHNVGNVLNSVYTSAQVARERLGGLRLENVGRAATMLEGRQAELGPFFTQDQRGRSFVPYLSRLGQNLLDERESIRLLLEDVGRYTEHIGDIVKLQQSYARTPRLHEPVGLAELVEDALRINSAALSRHQVKVERDMADLAPVMTDKHKVLMILINLVSNAKYALDAVPESERRLTVRLRPPAGDSLRVQVIDNGVGIAPELLTRIFQYGFTTREEGHGFGLHSCALAAQELGGSLTAHSEGPGKGATFTLELPYKPVQEGS